MTDVCPPIGPRPGALVRSIVDDAAPRRRAGHDQQRLVARIRQDGVSGDWTAEDEEGRPLLVSQGEAGDLEVYNPGEAEGDQADPEIIPTTPPGAASLDQLRRRMAPRRMHDRTLSSQQQGDQLKAWQAYNEAIWTPKS
jgi:hypothetical protein